MSAKWYRAAVDQLLAVESIEELDSTVAELMKRPPAGYAAKQITHLVPDARLEELQQHYPGLHAVTNLIEAVRRQLRREKPVEIVDQSTGEVVELMTKDEAREFVSYIRTQQEELPRRIVDAWQRRAWIALGYKSWDSMCDGEELQLRLPRADREPVVMELRSAGMSIPAIASATGASVGTVHGDLSKLKSRGEHQPERVTSLDGRERPAKQPLRPRPEPESAAEIAAAVNKRRRERLAELEKAKQTTGGGAAAGDVREDHAPPSELTPDPKVQEFVESDPKVQDAHYMREFTKALARSGAFLRFDADRVGRLATADEVVSLEYLAESTNKFLSKVQAARAQLRVIKGGKS